MSFSFPSTSLLVWVLTTIFVHAANSVPASVPVDQSIYEFGLIPVGTVVHHTFVLNNSGKSDLEVEKVSTSCGCTTLAAYPHRIPSGNEGNFEAVMNHQHTGYTDIAIYVQTGPLAKDLHAFHLVGVLIDKLAAGDATNPSLVTAKEVLGLQTAAKPVTIVDVRAVNLFIQSHAKGAQNITPFALEARADLKVGTVVLINDGIRDPALLARIDRLKQLGFQDVRLLAGGLRAWVAAGGSVQGAALPKSSSFALVSAADFYAEQRTSPNWQVITTDAVLASVPTAYPVKNLPVQADPEDFARKLAGLVRTLPSNVQVVIASGRGEGYDQMEAALSAIKPVVPIYYLQNGVSGYVAFVAEQAAALSPEKVALNNEKAFLPSTRTAGQILHGGGCASCGH